MRDTEQGQSGCFLAHKGHDGRNQSVRDHLVGVSRATANISGKIGLGPAGAIIGLLHDLGKYSGDFQRYLQQINADQDSEAVPLVRGMVDHSTAGAQTIWRALAAKGKLERVAAEILSLCVASHHSGLIDCVAPDSTDHLTRRMNKADADSHYSEVWRSIDPLVARLSSEYLENPDLITCLRRLISGLCQIDSNETILRFKVGLLVRFLFSGLIDADRTDTADFSNPICARLRQNGHYVGWPVLIDRLERKLKSFRVRHGLNNFAGTSRQVVCKPQPAGRAISL